MNTEPHNEKPAVLVPALYLIIGTGLVIGGVVVEKLIRSSGESYPNAQRTLLGYVAPYVFLLPGFAFLAIVAVMIYRARSGRCGFQREGK